MNKVKEQQICINLYKEVFGLNKPSILKIIKNRKESISVLILFCLDVKEKYDLQLYAKLDKCIIDKKTTLRHFQNKDKTLGYIFYLLEELSKKNIKIKKSEISEERKNIRLSNIGKIC